MNKEAISCRRYATYYVPTARCYLLSIFFYQYLAPMEPDFSMIYYTTSATTNVLPPTNTKSFASAAFCAASKEALTEG